MGQRLERIHRVLGGGDKPAAEFIGTMMLTFTIGIAAAGKTSTMAMPFADGAFAPLSIGTMLAAMVYAGGPTSGGHFNPAVTLAATIRSSSSSSSSLKSSLKTVAIYWLAQFAGGFLGARAAAGVVGLENTGFPAVPVVGVNATGSQFYNNCKTDWLPSTVTGLPRIITDCRFANLGGSFLAEALGTFALCYVVLNVATTEASTNKSYFGVAIGLTVMSVAAVLGSISGGAFNPAVGIMGVSSFDYTTWEMGLYNGTWVYFAAPLLAAAVAAGVFRLQNPKEFVEEEPGMP